MNACDRLKDREKILSSIEESLLRERARLYTPAEDAWIRSVVAPRVALKIVEKSSYFTFTEEQVSAITNIVSMGLNFAMDEGEIVDIAAHVEAVAKDTDSFVATLLTIVSLRTARALHLLDLASNGRGISPDYDEESRSVESLILAGRIGVNVEKIVRSTVNGPEASYNAQDNEIIFLNRHIDLIPPLSWIGNIVHECTHAYQDSKKLRSSISEFEHQAYIRGYRTEMLADMRFGTEMPQFSPPYIMEVDRNRVLEEMDRDARACDGQDGAAIDSFMKSNDDPSQYNEYKWRMWIRDRTAQRNGSPPLHTPFSFKEIFAASSYEDYSSVSTVFMSFLKEAQEDKYVFKEVLSMFKKSLAVYLSVENGRASQCIDIRKTFLSTAILSRAYPFYDKSKSKIFDMFLEREKEVGSQILAECVTEDDGI